MSSRQLIIFSNRITMIDAIPDADAGALLKALLHYNEEGVLPGEMTPLAEIFFKIMKEDVDHNAKNYEARSAANRRAGQLGGIKSGEARRNKAKQNEANASNAQTVKYCAETSGNEANEASASNVRGMKNLDFSTIIGNGTGTDNAENEANEAKHYTLNTKPDTLNTKHRAETAKSGPCTFSKEDEEELARYINPL